jgi:hypothetical protein
VSASGWGFWRKSRTIATAAICLLTVAAAAQQHAASDKPSAERKPQITSFPAEPPNLVITGAYLSSVAIVGEPTGTEMAGAPAAELGEAHRATLAGPHEHWVMPLPPPSKGWSATSVSAIAYGAGNHFVGTKTLPYSGASEIGDALWPMADPKVFSHQKKIEGADSGKHFIFPDNWNFFVALDRSKYPRENFVVTCDPNYPRNPTVHQWPKKIQMGWPDTGFQTGDPGACTISNGDFQVTVQVLHGYSESE